MEGKTRPFFLKEESRLCLVFLPIVLSVLVMFRFQTLTVLPYREGGTRTKTTTRVIPRSLARGRRQKGRCHCLLLALESQFGQIPKPGCRTIHD